MAGRKVTPAADLDVVSSAVTLQDNPVGEQSVQQVELKRRALVKVYKTEELVPVTIAPLYAPYVGASMTVSINGITCVIPCDGRTHQVPESFAIEAKTRIYKIDCMITRKKKMQSISDNAEHTPGEIKFF